MNVCIETIEYEPITIEDVRDVLETLEEDLFQQGLRPSDLFQFSCL